jgi:hypothetical protein
LTCSDKCTKDNNCFPGVTCNLKSGICGGLNKGDTCIPNNDQCDSSIGLVCGLNVMDEKSGYICQQKCKEKKDCTIASTEICLKGTHVFAVAGICVSPSKPNEICNVKVNEQCDTNYNCTGTGNNILGVRILIEVIFTYILIYSLYLGLQF